jgi:hypothetical protein
MDLNNCHQHRLSSREDSLFCTRVAIEVRATRQGRPQGDKNGLNLPLMCDFVEILGLNIVLDRLGIDYTGRNFEEVYSDLYGRPECKEARVKIEDHIRNYFARMEFPEPPTFYDHLVLSLREKDVIATSTGILSYSRLVLETTNSQSRPGLSFFTVMSRLVTVLLIESKGRLAAVPIERNQQIRLETDL